MSSLKAVKDLNWLEERYISVQAWNDMNQSDFRPFCNDFRKERDEFFMYQKHFLLLRKKSKRDLKYLVGELQSGHSWLLPILKFGTVERSDLDMRMFKS